ncbi:MAG: hypothetical protein UHY90_05905 [Treponema sp.]|nr:hypothetical protein [Spirochaetia bacterium]MDD7460835.1 hypothetical protein [Spirochaetales bacterium]MDY5810969.1 hypothetical protein [Treponema sp.]MEE1181768.1 hypothetical protein [Treponema sp.]
MNRKCIDYMETFYSLDKHERLPLKISLHLLFCKECRTKVRNLTTAEKLLLKNALSKSEDSSKTATYVLNAISKTSLNYHEKKTSLRKWALSGTGLLACFLIIIPLLIIKGQDFLSLVSTISLSAVLCIWCFLFVGNNMDFFIKMSSRTQQQA